MLGQVAGEDRAAEEDRQDRAPDEGGGEAGGAAELGGGEAGAFEQRNGGDEQPHCERGDEEHPALHEVAAEEEEEAAHGQFPSGPAKWKKRLSRVGAWAPRATALWRSSSSSPSTSSFPWLSIPMWVAMRSMPSRS